MRGASVGRHPQALGQKRAQTVDLRWLAVVMLGLVLAWFIAPHPVVDADLSQSARQQEGSPQRVTVLQAQPVASPLRMNTVSTEQSCENVSVQGAHTAATMDEARTGATEDIGDLCPLNQLEQVSETCGADMAEDADGVAQQVVRCQQKGVCHMCGEHLSRRRELIGAR